MWTPRFIKEYTGEGKNLTLEAGRAKITGFPSKRLGLKRRGLIKNSYKADIAIFSFDDFNDKSNFLEPDMFIVYCNPYQLTHLLLAKDCIDGEGITSVLSGHNACILGIVPVLPKPKVLCCFSL